MNPLVTSHILVVAGYVLGSFFLGGSNVELTKIPKKPLPAQPPQLTELPLELPPEGGLRRPVDAMPSTTLSSPGPEIIIVELDQPALLTTVSNKTPP